MSAFPPLVGAKQTSFGHLVGDSSSRLNDFGPAAARKNAKPRFFGGSGASLTPLRVFEPNSMRR